MAIIEVTDLRKRYGDVWTVQGVSFTVEEGEVFGLLGPNGAGKTTTVECVGGLRRRDGGSVLVDGLDPAEHPLRLRQRVGMQLQETTLPALITVREALNLFARFYPQPADVDELIERLGLGAKAGTRFENLSGGQKQRLAVALALVGRPRVAVLDELTTGLDPSARRDVWSLLEDLRGDGTTLLLVSHFMEEVERLCDRVAIVDEGRIVGLDTPRAIVAAAANGQRLTFGLSAVDDPSGDRVAVDDRIVEEVLAELRGLPEVASVQRRGELIELRGGTGMTDHVLARLARRGLTTRGMQMEQGSLDDAYLQLVGRTERDS